MKKKLKIIKRIRNVETKLIPHSLMLKISLKTDYSDCLLNLKSQKLKETEFILTSSNGHRRTGQSGVVGEKFKLPITK